MTDEANSHYHAMLDQLIEGHQWVKNNLNFIPKSAWSIDPFGQGSTVPHLLASSGLSGAIIQRIHYSWKEVRKFIQISFQPKNYFLVLCMEPIWRFLLETTLG